VSPCRNRLSGRSRDGANAAANASAGLPALRGQAGQCVKIIGGQAPGGSLEVGPAGKGSGNARGARDRRQPHWLLASVLKHLGTRPGGCCSFSAGLQEACLRCSSLVDLGRQEVPRCTAQLREGDHSGDVSMSATGEKSRRGVSLHLSQQEGACACTCLAMSAQKRDLRCSTGSRRQQGCTASRRGT
jgi:hypothetical protein